MVSYRRRQSSRPRVLEGGGLSARLLGGDVRRDLVPLQDSIGLVAVQPQRFGELAMSNPFLAVEVDQVCLLRLPVHVQAVGAKLLLDVLRYFKADVHVTYLPYLVSSAATRRSSVFVPEK